jgi:hypothetical protein
VRLYSSLSLHSFSPPPLTIDYTVLIHCNKGKHRVGLLVCLIRRLQHWSLTAIFDEYNRSALPSSFVGGAPLIFPNLDIQVFRRGERRSSSGFRGMCSMPIKLAAENRDDRLLRWAVFLLASLSKRSTWELFGYIGKQSRLGCCCNNTSTPLHYIEAFSFVALGPVLLE